MGWNYKSAHTQCSSSHTQTSSSPWEHTEFCLNYLHKSCSPSSQLLSGHTFWRAGHGAWGWSITQTPGEVTEKHFRTWTHITLALCQWTRKCFHPLRFLGDWKVAIPSLDLRIPGKPVCLGWSWTKGINQVSLGRKAGFWCQFMSLWRGQPPLHPSALLPGWKHKITLHFYSVVIHGLAFSQNSQNSTST